MIQAKGIERRFGSLQVLHQVSLEVQAGEIVSISGRSGAGKSTLLHILGTLDRPDAGQIRIDGEEISGLSDKALSQFRNKHIGFVFQFHHLLPEFTAEENLMIPWLIQGKAEAKARQKARELLDLLGLKERFQHKPNALSGGEQQRVAVARALMNDPKVVFADEPSGNLDSQTAEQLHHLFFKLRKELGQTFVIVTHNQELAGMTDRNIEMRDGRILGNDE